jgi:3-oxoacyl-[acyl-carrier protein] reductase
MMQQKTAIITGASRGIGKAAALKLAQDGFNIAVIYAGNTEAAGETAELVEKQGVCAHVIKCDVADFEACKNAVGLIKDKFGSIDVLVNNAGITKDGLIMKMSEEQFDDVVDVSLKGAFNMIRHCAPIFVKQRGGKIINIASVAGVMGNAGQANYSAAKAGMIGLTKSIARELAGRNICCNAIAPGFIETDMTAALGDLPLKDMIPLKRMGKAEEIAALVSFLASENAAYITGEVIKIDGGLAM